MTRDRQNREKIITWKMNATGEDGTETARYADALAALINKALPVRPQGTVLTIRRRALAGQVSTTPGYWAATSLPG